MMTTQTVAPEPPGTRESSLDTFETDDDFVRTWQEELREAREKMEAYRSNSTLARRFGADAQHTKTMLTVLPQRIAARRAEIADERWASRTFAGLPEIPVVSMDRSFVSIEKADLARIAPQLASAIPKKSHLWADWSVWNFRRHSLRRADALPAEAVRRARGALDSFEGIEVWHAVGTQDPWLVGRVLFPRGGTRFYLLFDWGLETTGDRRAFR